MITPGYSKTTIIFTMFDDEIVFETVILQLKRSIFNAPSSQRIIIHVDIIKPIKSRRETIEAKIAANSDVDVCS